MAYNFQVHHEVHHTPQPMMLQNQQTVTVHQVHHPGVEIIHPHPGVHFLHPLPVAYHPHPHYIHPGFHAPMPMPMPMYSNPVIPQAVARQPHRVVYIVSYSTHRLATGDRLALAEYHNAVNASGQEPLITFDVSHFPSPRADLCAVYSGMSRQVQNIVKGDRECMRDLDDVVRLTMSAFDQGAGSLLLLVASPGGTHRSVAAAEVIKRKLERRGVTSVHVTHAHHVRRPGEAR